MFFPFPLTKKSTLIGLGIITLLGGCGGSDNEPSAINSDDEPREIDSDNEANTISIEGSVFASKVSGATVYLENFQGIQVGGTANTNDNGEYVLNIDINNAQTGGYFLTSSGGTYIDEATGVEKNARELKVYIDNNNAIDDKINLTPSSTIIAYMVQEEGLSGEAAQALFENAFSYHWDISITPVDITEPESASESVEKRLSGLHAASFSQLSVDLGIDQFDLLKVMAEDLSDGQMDGERGGVPVDVGDICLPQDIQAQYADSFIHIYQSDLNKSGLGDSEIGTLPKFDVASTASYIVRYSPVDGMENAAVGRNALSLEVTDRSGMPVSGKYITLNPLMYMPGHAHATAYALNHDDEESEEGIYSGDIYYVMSSETPSGVSLGWWRIGVCISDTEMDNEMDMEHGVSVCPTGSEEAVFYPTVTNKVGVRATMRGGENDQIPGMMKNTIQARTYHLYKHSADVNTESDGSTHYHAHVYISAMESMFNFPGLTEGLVLNEGTDSELTVEAVGVEFSGDGGDNWIAASNDHSGGMWAADMEGAPGTMQIRLVVNGEQKTSGANDHVELEMGGEMSNTAAM